MCAPKFAPATPTAAQRQALIKKPPHILVTTPESLYLLLTSESGRRHVAHGAHAHRGRDPRGRGRPARRAPRLEHRAVGGADEIRVGERFNESVCPRRKNQSKKWRAF